METCMFHESDEADKWAVYQVSLMHYLVEMEFASTMCVDEKASSRAG